jgi:hypothetical protein
MELPLITVDLSRIAGLGHIEPSADSEMTCSAISELNQTGAFNLDVSAVQYGTDHVMIVVRHHSQSNGMISMPIPVQALWHHSREIPEFDSDPRNALELAVNISCIADGSRHLGSTAVRHRRAARPCRR